MPKEQKPVVCQHCCCTICKRKDYAGCRARSCPMKAGEAFSKLGISLQPLT